MNDYRVQPSFDILVANHTGELDELGNPVKARSGFKVTTVFAGNGEAIYTPIGGTPPTASTATITVNDNTFVNPGDVILYLGKFTLRSGVDWVPAGTVTGSATALALAISRLPALSAIGVGADVQISGPDGIIGLGIRFLVTHNTAIEHFILSPLSGTLQPGNPTVNDSDMIIP